MIKSTDHSTTLNFVTLWTLLSWSLINQFCCSSTNFIQVKTLNVCNSTKSMSSPWYDLNFFDFWFCASRKIIILHSFHYGNKKVVIVKLKHQSPLSFCSHVGLSKLQALYGGSGKHSGQWQRKIFVHEVLFFCADISKDGKYFHTNLLLPNKILSRSDFG